MQLDVTDCFSLHAHMNGGDVPPPSEKGLRMDVQVLNHMVHVCDEVNSKILRGRFRNALKFVLEEASFVGDVARGWKLLVMLPRMLLHRRPGGSVVSKAKLVERFEMFARDQWDQLIRASEDCVERDSSGVTTQAQSGQ